METVPADNLSASVPISGHDFSQEGGKAGRFDDGSDEIIGACVEVHRHLGPGLLENIYEECLCYELSLRGLSFERQRTIQFEYKGMLLDDTYRIDLIVEDALLIEVKSVERVLPVHRAQVITYLQLTGLQTGLLVNFNSPTLKAGLRRLTRKREA